MAVEMTKFISISSSTLFFVFVPAGLNSEQNSDSLLMSRKSNGLLADWAMSERSSWGFAVVVVVSWAVSWAWLRESLDFLWGFLPGCFVPLT